MTGTFIDTIVICTMTGLSIVITGTWQVRDWKVWKLRQRAFQKGLPFPPGCGILCIDDLSGILCIYNDSWMGLLRRTMPGISVQYGHMKAVRACIPMAYILYAVFIGPYMTVSGSMEYRRYLQCI